jgi:hypothetical protein
MIDIVLFSLISALIIAIFSYLEANASTEEEIDSGVYFKTFLIAFIVNGIGILIFKNMTCDSPFSAPVEVGLLD